MLLGQEERRLSSLLQVAFPHRFRVELGDELIITKGQEQCLQIVSAKEKEILLEGTKNKPFLDKATREIQRYIFANAVQLKLDKQGRMRLPEYLVTYGKLENDVIFAGIDRYVEVWSKPLFKKHMKHMEKSKELLTVNLSESYRHE